MANSNSSMFSLIKAYSLPFLLLSLAISFQLFVIPNSYPVSHYKVLGIDRYSSIEKVEEAYLKLSSQWNSSVEGRMTNDFIKVRYAFELLSNPLWKRDYDIFGIDEQSDVLARFKGQDAESFSKVELPLLKDSSSDLLDHPSNVLTAENFQSTVGLTGAWLIQVYSSGSKSCAEFHHSWKRIANLLDGVASTGMVELGEVPLATYLAEKKPTGEPFFRQGLPSLVALPAGCRNSDCFVRYYGDLSVDAVTDWFATDILGLPRILYYTKDILGKKFIAKSGPHKVKVICFSKTGERATPFLRQAAKNYWDYASFAFVLWQEEQSSLWWNTFEVESAPAVVFIKDPGVKPVVFHGAFNSSSFSQIMEQNKQQELPQLRSSTSLQLGCDSRGYSRAGNEINTWYCVILAGRLSPELNQMRDTIRKTQDILLNEEQSSPLAASVALKDKRLTFTWLDGEAQKKYCFFYINSETSYETCGERRDIGDVPQIVILRYKRDDTQKKVDRKPKTVWDSFQEDDENLASQLVAKYNGSADISEITKWVSQIIEDGDSRDLPFFRTQTPNLVPEDADPMWARGAQSVVSTSKGMKQRIQNLLSRIYDWMGDPRTGPMLFLGAVLSFGGIWFNRNQPSKKPSQPSEARSEESEPSQSGPGGGTGGRIRRRRKSNVDQPSSITDVEPRDAYQALSSGSDTD